MATANAVASNEGGASWSRDQGTGETDPSVLESNDLENSGCPPGQSPDHSKGTRGYAAVKDAVKTTLSSPGFLAIAAGFVTGCIVPLRDTMFENGGAVRFLGSAVETLGHASSPISTMIVAAILAGPPQSNDDDRNEQEASTQDIDHLIMPDPSYGPYRRRRSSVRRMKKTLTQKSSRLIVLPAVVGGVLAWLDCGGVLPSLIPNLTKLVIVINSCLPGALVVVVLLKSKEAFHDRGVAVARVYLPAYLLSIVTIAGWTAVGTLDHSSR